MKIRRALTLTAVFLLSLGLVSIVFASVQGPRQPQAIDCAAFENYPGAEPAGYAEACLGIIPRTARSTAETSTPDSPGFAHDIGFISDNLVSFPLDDFSAQTVFAQSSLEIFGYDFDPTATTLYALNNGTDRLGTIDLATGAFITIGVSSPRPGHTWSGLTIHPILGTLYAASTNGLESTLYTLDPGTGTATVIGTSDLIPVLIDIAINRDGELYGHEIVNDQIVRIDPATGSPTVIGPTGYDANFAQGMDFDNDDGTLYIFLYLGGGSNIFGTVNLSSGAVTPHVIDDPLGEFEGATQTTPRDLILDKTVGLDSNSCAATDRIDILAGTEVVYCYEVTNTGDITRSIHDLVDSELGSILSGFSFDLAPGSSVWLTQTATILTTTVNTATWTAYNPGPVEIVSSTAVATVVVPPPSIQLTKTVGLDPNACSNFNLIPIPPGGAQVTYCYEVRNTGLISLTRHDLADNQLGIILNDFAFTLLPGASVWLTQTAFITENIVNTATWTAFNPGPVQVAVSEDRAEVVLATGLGCGNPAEGFEYGVPTAASWLTATTTGPVYWATTANENACYNGVNNTPGTGFAACADSDKLNFDGAPYNAELWSNQFSLTTTAQASLRFAAAYDDNFSLPGTDTFDVDVSDDGGASWTNALRWNEPHDGGEIVEIDLNPYVGETDVRVRFRYYSQEGGWDWWVHIDEVEVVCGDPTIELVKTVGTDPGACSPLDSLTVNMTTTVHYCYEVTNLSGITLTTHDLVDSELGPILTAFPFDLAPGGSVWLTQSAVITETTVNLATWTAVSSGPLLFTGTDTISATVVVDPDIEDSYLINLPIIFRQLTP